MSILKPHLLRRWLAYALFGLAMAAAAVPLESAFAQSREQEAEERRRARQTLSPAAGRSLNEALNLANEEPPQTRQAVEVINKLLQRDLSPFDKSTALEVRGQLLYQLDNLNGALREFVEVLRIDALPLERLRQIRRNVAQLYYTQERYSEAIRFMETYIREAGADAQGNDYFILAASYAQTENYRGARRPAESAVRLDQPVDRKKLFYDLINLIYNELRLESERGQLLERMVEYFPSEESYWVQLASAYSAANRRGDALAALEVAYAAGLIDDEAKIVTLAQFYYDQNNPYRGARLLSREMKAGNVSRELKNLELLAQLWAAAREQDEAIAILTEAAPKRSDGRLYYQLGQSYFADERWRLAVQNLRSAINRGGLSDREIGNAYVLIGTALFQQDSDTEKGRADSRSEFVRAQRYPGTSSVASSWVQYIDTIEATLKAQAEVERIQAVARKEAEINRCNAILDVIERGGRTEVAEERITACRALRAQVEEGLTADELVDLDQAAEAESEDDAEAEGEDG